jgi:serine/threonine protein kinase/tetratricopeptide (TPR) repeat protein
LSELLDRLQAALDPAYRLQRELGGGMSRVYQAEETALGRQVVIKVLPPDLAAAISVERFRREIQLAAKLQHPHIVPVLAAGRAGELLFYTMPYIEGESLRAKLAREGELPVTDTVRLLRDVVDALAYAHELGVVHRDIKPDNVMVSRNHALVTDFGVAKAVSEAVASDGLAPGSLTTGGVAMGTPAYMAPEQAAADPSIDHRADIYAVGVMAYEMLAGFPPFAGRTPQQLLAAHVSRTPEPLEAVRATVPPELAAIVMRCLEKRPADRWQSANELLKALETVATPSTGTASTVAHRTSGVAPTVLTPVPRRGPRGVTVLGAAALAAIATLLGLRMAGLLPGSSLVGRGLLKERERILVSDFRSPPVDSALGGAVTEAFRIDLAQSPTVTVLQPDYVQQTLARMQRDPRAPLDAGLAREVAIRDGIKAFVAGDVAHAGTGYVISARLMSTESGDALVALRETASDSSRILAAIDRLSKALRQRIGESLQTVRANEPLDQVSTGSLDALRKYSLALAADRDGDTERALALLRESVALDTAFAMAYRKLGVITGNSGGLRSEQREAYRQAYEHRDRLTDRERYLTQAVYAAQVLGDREQEITAYRSLLDVYPNDMVALNNLAIAYSALRDFPRAEELARRAIAAEPGSSVGYLTAMQAQVSSGKVRDAQALLDTMRTRVRSQTYPDFVAAGMAAMAGDYDTASAILHRVQATRRESPNWRMLTSFQLAAVAATLGRLGEADDHLRQAAEDAATQGIGEQELQAELARAGIDLWFRGRRDRALQHIDRALTKRPLASFDAADRPYLALAILLAEAGRPDRARTLVAEFERQAPLGERRLADPSRHAVLGSIALAERRPHEAISEFRQSDVGDCTICALPNLGRAYEAAGDADSAIAAYQRYATAPYLHRLEPDAVWLGHTYLRLGELYEEKGERARAADYYGKLVRLLGHADPELRGKVSEAKRRLELLTGERAVS